MVEKKRNASVGAYFVHLPMIRAPLSTAAHRNDSWLTRKGSDNDSGESVQSKKPDKCIFTDDLYNDVKKRNEAFRDRSCMQ